MLVVLLLLLLINKNTRIVFSLFVLDMVPLYTYPFVCVCLGDEMVAGIYTQSTLMYWHFSTFFYVYICCSVRSSSEFNIKFHF